MNSYNKKIGIKLYILFLFILINVKAFSQINFGIKTGLNFSGVKYENPQTEELISPYKKIKPGINLGTFFSANFNKIMKARIEILYSEKGLKYDQPSYRFGKNTMNYIEIPVTGGIVIPTLNNFKTEIYIGGYYGFWLSGKYIYTDYYTYETINTKVDFSNEIWQYNRNDAGLLCGIQIELSRKIFADIRYTHGFISSSALNADGLYNRLISTTVYLAI